MSESIVVNCDCMEYMRRVPDKAFDLAVVDPPYGIGIDRHKENRKIKVIGGVDDPSAARRIKPYSAAKSNLTKQNFIRRSTTAPRRTKSISGSWNVSAGTESSGAATFSCSIWAARPA